MIALGVINISDMFRVTHRFLFKVLHHVFYMHVGFFKFHQISPSEIESVILKHPAVAQVCVIGVDDPDGGDKIPRAWVILKAEFSKTCGILDEIKNFANGVFYCLIL